ncbi:VanW family protein [Candidatus Clostridium radicumherbarum]|uniref:VanW family protein n=1 Tax=Candidatus Clostridium radicumherbarum TaxID=3381662 RepID=A0ABW8TME5_9CLOT
MDEKNINIRKVVNIILLEFILSSTGILAGYGYKLYEENKKWDMLLYPGIKIEGIDVGGKSKEECLNIVQAKLSESVLREKSILKTKDKTFEIENSKIIDKFNIDAAVTEALDFTKSMDPLKKHYLIKNGVQKEYKVDVTYNKTELNNLLKTIEKEINKDPINASIIIDPTDTKITYYEGKDGIKVKTAELENNIKDSLLNNTNEDSSIKIPTAEVMPALTSDHLTNINSIISSFSTYYAESSYQRSNNIKLAASFINGKILMPGETFSFNDTVGERTKERGFLEAPVIVDNKVESGFGGGICQVSSTLYNAVLLAGMNATERTHHTLPSAYVKLGMDATVDWNNIDFKFKNTLEYPLLIDMSAKDGVLKVNLLSNSEASKKKYLLKNDIYETINSSTTLVNDSNLAIGSNKVVQNSYTGFKVKVIRSTYDDGKLVSSEVISNDYYSPVNGVIKVGAKGN